jgi:NADH-ubiquinone oxidoreductase chain 2
MSSFSITNYNWTISLLISSFLSLIIGTIGGLTQFRIKKLYAYSSISHIGFLLLALCINSLESTQAFFFYIIQYSISNLNAFIILFSSGVLFYFFKNKSYKHLQEKIYSPVQFINQFKGFFLYKFIFIFKFNYYIVLFCRCSSTNRIFR